MYVNDHEGRQALHYNRRSAREDGWAVLDRDSGSCRVIINTGDVGEGASALTVQGGSALAGGVTVEITDQPIDIPAAQTEPRKDVLALTQDGVVIRFGGDQEPISPSGRSLQYAERPAPPDLFDEPVVPLAEISVPADATAISTDHIRDIRPSADYVVGTINGHDPDALVSSEGDQDVNSEWTFNDGLKSTQEPQVPTDVLRLSDASGFADSETVSQLETRLDELGYDDVDAFPAAGGTVTGDVTVEGDTDSNSFTATGTGQNGGYQLSDGIYYTVVDGVATIYSFSSEGGQGWALSDPDGVGDAVAIDPNGNTGIAGSFDSGGPIREDGSRVLTALGIEDDGSTVGDAQTINLGTDLSASLADGVVTINASASGGMTSLPISDSGSSAGDASEIDFGENLSASVTDGVASIDSQGASSQSTVRAVDYGADPSGETASTSALQSAIDDANEGDRVVWGETGTFYLDGEITVTKRVEVDLFEGVIESDHHDEQAYPDDQSHYMPLFRFRGSIGDSSQLIEVTDRGEDQVVVENPGEFSVGEGVLLRTSTTNQTTVPDYGYMCTQTRIREIQDGVIYLEDNAIYPMSVGDYLSHADFLERPEIKNVHLQPRNEPTFDADAGKVLGGFRHGFATEVCDNPLLENCSVVGYDSHLWSSRDDISPELRNCEAREPMNVSGSCGEPVHIQSSRDVSIVHPTIKEARRAIDVRSGCGTVTVDQPDITGVSFVGISWHSTTSVASDIVVNGGRVEAKPDDPTQDNKDGSDDTQRTEVQSGRPFNTAINGTLIANGVTFVGRQDGVINGSAEINGGELYKYRTAGTVLTLNGEDITIDGMEFGSLGSVDRLIGTDADTDAAHCTLTDITLDCSGAPNRAVEILAGEDISVSGRVTEGASAAVDIEGGTNLDFDLDMQVSGNYSYIIYGGTGIDIEGRAAGGVGNESIRIDGGEDIDIDMTNNASGATDVRGVRILGGEDIDITGSYQGPGIGVMFSGGATSVTVHDMRVEVTDPDRAGAVGTDGGATGLSGIKWINNDLRGEVSNILMNDTIEGFWAVNNVTDAVEYPTDSTVGQIAGNMVI